MVKRAKMVKIAACRIVVLISLVALFSVPSTAQGYLSPDERGLLEEMFAVHMNYFLSPEIIAEFALPMTAYKVGNRARFGYSNPTEWGYAFQAWIAASEREIISTTEAVAKLRQGLATLEALQEDQEETYQGFPYPFYKMTTPQGKDLAMPYRDPYPQIPSGDDALLYASLTIVEGWARIIGDQELWEQAQRIRDRMDFSIFLKPGFGDCLYLAHTIDANVGGLSDSNWDIFADEGGVVAWVAYLSGSISLEEYMTLTECQHRQAASWEDCSGKLYTVFEAAWFNAMFPWSVRSLAGFPIGSFDAPEGCGSLYSKESLVPTVQAHLGYGDCVGVDHPAFSDAMSQAEYGQGLVGWIQNWYMPPNLAVKAGSTPTHVVPHALFVPFNALPVLPSETRARLVSEIRELKADQAAYFHDSGAYPFGFEVTASPYTDDLGYQGADDGRLVFETLSEAYVALSLFNALQIDDRCPTFSTIAMHVPGYREKVTQVLRYLYPE
jgi:hypothetical protein